MSKLAELAEMGQAVWLDYIRRSFTRSGALDGALKNGVRGVTSNPSIFEAAIGDSDDYDETIRALAGTGRSPQELYETLAIEDIREAADHMRPLYEQTKGLDGYVSLEVGPNLAHDTQGTLDEAIRLNRSVDRPNLLVKIPATPEGIPAIREAIARGISINVTLIFSIQQYEQVFEAWLSGLELALERGEDISRIASVASVFVSRVDSAVDRALDERGGPADLKGMAAVDNTRLIYARFNELRAAPRCGKILAQGAQIQRPLWASTGTKNPDYPDTLYIDQLIGPDTVNTAPIKTIEAFLNHGTVRRTIDLDLDGARERRARLAEAGVDLDQILVTLLDEGVASFAASFEKLILQIEEKVKTD
jgi:transaldolase